ncbi:MAG TPA: sulfatase, partial [Planctomycetaceae bacterium]|nr:sulfatase [Planctomycetaceae bacterium]
MNDSWIARRRWFISQCGLGLGHAALTSLLARSALGQVDPLAPKPSHHPAKIKNVILLYMGGGPSQLELFDNKPTLRRLDGSL